jgi:hypothetical protein
MASVRNQDVRVALTSLAVVLGTDRVSVWQVSGDEPNFLQAKSLDADDMARALHAWGYHRPDLRGGRAVHDGDDTVYPIMDNRLGILGFLCVLGGDAQRRRLRHVQTFVEGTLGSLAVSLSRTESEDAGETDDARELQPLAARPEPALVLVATASRDSIDRARLLMTLQAHDWNCSRVGKLLGHARSTIWRWMKTYGIERPFPSPHDPRPPKKRSKK